MSLTAADNLRAFKTSVGAESGGLILVNSCINPF
jgi:hypothetical protein